MSNHWKLMKGYPASGGYPAVPYTSNICIIQKLGSRDLVQEILGTVDHPIHTYIYIYISISTHTLKPNFDPRSQMSHAESPIKKGLSFNETLRQWLTSNALAQNHNVKRFFIHYSYLERSLFNIWVCLKIVYPYTQWLMIIIPIKWL